MNTGAASYVNLWEERERDLIVMELLVNIMCTLNNVYNKDKNKIKPTVIIGFVQRRAWHYYYKKKNDLQFTLKNVFKHMHNIAFYYFCFVTLLVSLF